MSVSVSYVEPSLIHIQPKKWKQTYVLACTIANQSLDIISKVVYTQLKVYANATLVLYFTRFSEERLIHFWPISDGLYYKADIGKTLGVRTSLLFVDCY